MTSRYDGELLDAARHLSRRRIGQRGRLPAARVRRSISTTYYALFHFLLEEVGARLIGSDHRLRRRRRILARTLTHAGIRTTLDKMLGANADPSVAEFLRGTTGGTAPVSVPGFVRELARTFADPQAKRNDADYDLNKPLSEEDASVLRRRVRRVVAGWRSASAPGDRDFKRALCILLLLRGQLRREN